MDWEQSLSCHYFPALRQSSECKKQGWVIRIRLRMPPRSTQTEVNEHVCLQRDASLSQPAVTCLEGNCWERPLYLPVIQTSSQSELFTPTFLLLFLGSLPSDFLKGDVALFLKLLGRSDPVVWNMPHVHDKLSLTLIIHTDAEDCPWRMTVSVALAASVTNQVIILPSHKIASARVTTFATHCISGELRQFIHAGCN